jgi:Arc/MetJ family transcription regulator
LKKAASGLDPHKLPTPLITALEALYGHYAKTFELWQRAGINVPPCFIVVCNNTATSKLVYDYIAGFERAHEDGTHSHEAGRLELFRNHDEHGNALGHPRTLLIDSEQLESGEVLDDNFRGVAADEIERFRREIIERSGDPSAADTISGLFNVEYADVLGIPFDFNAEPVFAPPQKPRETVRVQAVRPDRDALEIRFPRVQGYRIELPQERITASFDADSTLTLTPELVGATATRNSGIIGEPVDLTLAHTADVRPSQVVHELTSHLVLHKWRDPGEAPRLHLFGQLKRIVKQWLDEGRCSTTSPLRSKPPSAAWSRTRSRTPGSASSDAMLDVHWQPSPSSVRMGTMRTTVTLDDELLAKAAEAMGITERSVLLHEGLKLIVQREAARRLILLGGTMPDAKAAPRRRSAPARPARRAAK